MPVDASFVSTLRIRVAEWERFGTYYKVDPPVLKVAGNLSELDLIVEGLTHDELGLVVALENAFFPFTFHENLWLLIRGVGA